MGGVGPRYDSQAGADFIGFVFAPSRRQITREKTQEIIEAVSNDKVQKVGVFVNLPADNVNTLAATCDLDWVQLSGDETWEYCQQIESPLIKAVHVSARWAPDELLAHLGDGQRVLVSRPPIYLLDTQVEHQYGGTGRVFDWGLARQAAAEFPVIIAGGLNAENVVQAIISLRPWGVDVSSGVESKGVKSVAKIKAFIKAVRSMP